MVELLHRSHEAEVPLLDEIEQSQPARLVAAGDRHEEAQVGLDEPAARLDRFGERLLELGPSPRARAWRPLQLDGGLAARVERPAERLLVGRREQRMSSDLVEITTQELTTRVTPYGHRRHGSQRV